MMIFIKGHRSRVEDITTVTHFKTNLISVCQPIYNWLVGFIGTAAQYRLYSAGECSECEIECVCRMGGVVPPCTLEQWVNSPPPSHIGDHAFLCSCTPA